MFAVQCLYKEFDVFKSGGSSIVVRRHRWTSKNLGTEAGRRLILLETPSLTLFTGSLLSAVHWSRQRCRPEDQPSMRLKTVLRMNSVTSVIDQVGQRKRYIYNTNAATLLQYYSHGEC